MSAGWSCGSVLYGGGMCRVVGGAGPCARALLKECAPLHVEVVRWGGARQWLAGVLVGQPWRLADLLLAGSPVVMRTCMCAPRGLREVYTGVVLWLRAGALVVLGAGHVATNQRTGLIDHRLVGAAVAAKVKILPAAAVSVPTRRDARVEIGPPVRLRRKRRGPLEELETADLLQARIDDLLAELGGALTGTPLDWLPSGGIGGL